MHYFQVAGLIRVAFFPFHVSRTPFYCSGHFPRCHFLSSTAAEFERNPQWRPSVTSTADVQNKTYRRAHLKAAHENLVHAHSVTTLLSSFISGNRMVVLQKRGTALLHFPHALGVSLLARTLKHFRCYY